MLNPAQRAPPAATAAAAVTVTHVFMWFYFRVKQISGPFAAAPRRGVGEIIIRHIRSRTRRYIVRYTHVYRYCYCYCVVLCSRRTRRPLSPSHVTRVKIVTYAPRTRAITIATTNARAAHPAGRDAKGLFLCFSKTNSSTETINGSRVQKIFHPAQT